MQSRHSFLGIAALLWHAGFPAAHAAGQQTDVVFPDLATGAVAHSAQALTLDQAIALALSANPALRAASRSIGIADGAILQAGLRPNPALSVLVEGSERRRRTDTAQLSQVIELGGKRAARIASAQQERALALSTLDVQRAQLRADVIAAYMDALTAQQALALVQASADLARTSSDVSRRRVQAGRLSPVDLSRAELAQATVELEVTQASAALAIAQRRLAALWASTGPFDRRLQTPDPAFARLPPWPVVAARLAAAPQLRQAQSTVDGRDAEVALQRTQGIPDVTVTLGFKRERDAGPTQAILGLSVPLPLFDRKQGDLLAALRSADQARDEREAVRLRLGQALADAYQRAQVATQQASTLREQILPAAQTSHDAAVRGFELGKFSLSVVLDAQRTLIQARSLYLRALAEQYRSIADINRHVPEQTQ